MPSKSASARLRIVASVSDRPQSISQQIRSCPTALTVDDVAEFLNLAPKTIDTMSFSGRIPSLKIGSVLRLDPETLANWVDARTVGAGKAA